MTNETKTMNEQNYIERYWRDAKPEDLTKPQLMVARFKYYPDGFPGNWEITIDLLGGFSKDKSGVIFEWFDSSGNGFDNAQVYDAPDPGEGWRLVDVDSEKPMVKDEMKYGDGWLIHNHNKPYDKQRYYRRRIEPPKPKYVPFRWEDREQLRGRWITREKDGYVIEEIAYRFDSRAFEVVAKNLLQDWKFLDTGEPVGRKVQ